MISPQQNLATWTNGVPITDRLASVSVPSRQPLELLEVLVDQVGSESWVRFRFVAPQIGKQSGDLTFSDVEQDFMHLCENLVLPYLKDYALNADVVVITLLSRPVSFGQSDADATQYVEVFRVSSRACIWEGL